MTSDSGPTVTHQIDCILHVSDATDLLGLQRSLFSLYGQTHRPLNVILAMNASSAELGQRVDAILKDARSLPAPLEFSFARLHPSLFETKEAEPIFEAGLNHVRGRYVAYLNAGDVLYPEAYSTLVARLHNSGAAIAFASIRRIGADADNGYVYVSGIPAATVCTPSVDALTSGDLALWPGFLVDRSRVHCESVHFDRTLNFGLAADWLLRLCVMGRGDFSAAHVCLADQYVWKNPSSPSSGVDPARRSKSEEDEWTVARLEAYRVLLQSKFHP